MNISFVLVVDGTTIFPTATLEGAATNGAAQLESVSGKEQADRSTPLLPIGSSVLAPGLGAAVEF